jgi:hypothetical protein
MPRSLFRFCLLPFFGCGWALFGTRAAEMRAKARCILDTCCEIRSRQVLSDHEPRGDASRELGGAREGGKVCSATCVHSPTMKAELQAEEEGAAENKAEGAAEAAARRLPMAPTDRRAQLRFMRSLQKRYSRCLPCASAFRGPGETSKGQDAASPRPQPSSDTRHGAAVAAKERAQARACAAGMEPPHAWAGGEAAWIYRMRSARPLPAPLPLTGCTPTWRRIS